MTIYKSVTIKVDGSSCYFLMLIRKNRTFSLKNSVYLIFIFFSLLFIYSFIRYTVFLQSTFI